MTTAPPFIVGWQEWVALPELGLPAIKAKIDTGARSSALHAFMIEPFGPASHPMVRFGIHPIPGRVDVEVFCSAPVIDRREVTSSNGEAETRYFIRSAIELGGTTWPIDIGLTNRETMAYRMLLGRQAIREDMMVDPAASFRHPPLTYRLYRHIPRRPPATRSLRIALVSRTPGQPFNLRLVEAATARNHVLELLDIRRMALSFDAADPRLFLDGEPLAHYDAVIPRLGTDTGALGAAVIRHFEMMGSFALNSGDALDRRTNRLATLQALGRAHIPHAMRRRRTGHDSVGEGDPKLIATYLRILIVGETAVTVVRHQNGKDRSTGPKRHRAARRLAERTAAALDLQLAAVDIDPETDPPKVLRITARPALRRFERSGDVPLAEELLQAIENSFRTRERGITPSQPPKKD